MLTLGLDIGTTAVKALVVDDGDRVVAEAAVEHPTVRPAPGLNEQNPDDWIAATRVCLDAVRARAPEALPGVGAIGLSGQMHSPVLLGDDLRPLLPALLWNDARGTAECEALLAAVPDVGAITGVVPMAGFSAAKILWIRNHKPDVFRRIAHLLLPKDYVRLWLTGALATDVSDAAGTQLLDEASRSFSPLMLSAVGLDARQMPALHDGADVAGVLRREAAEALGLPPGIPVVAGGGDAATGAVGINCFRDRAGFISLGTAATFVVMRDVYRPRPEMILHTFAHCLPGRWYQMAGMLNGAGCLAWALALVGAGDAERTLAAIAARYRGPSPVMFLPYLNGERTPHNDPSARGVLTGLEYATGPLDIVQAVLEGVAFSIREADVLLTAAGSRCETPDFIGGGARSGFWAELVATILGRPIRRIAGGAMGPALGAARLARMGLSGSRDLPDAAAGTFEMIAPMDAWVDAYAARFDAYRRLYPAVRPYS